MKLRLFSFLAGVFVISAAPAQNPNLIQNGNFETGTFAFWTRFVTNGGDISDTFMTVPAVRQFDVDGDGNMSLAAALSVGRDRFNGQPGPQGGGLFQQFTLTQTGSIRLSLSAAVWFDSSVSGNADGGTFQLMLDGVVLDSWISGQVLGGQEPKRKSFSSFALNVPAGTHEFRIRILRNFDQADDLYQFVDDVVVQEVPEPGTGALIVAGSILLGLARSVSRRSKSKLICASTLAKKTRRARAPNRHL